MICGYLNNCNRYQLHSPSIFLSWNVNFENDVGSYLSYLSILLHTCVSNFNKFIVGTWGLNGDTHDSSILLTNFISLESNNIIAISEIEALTNSKVFTWNIFNEDWKTEEILKTCCKSFDFEIMNSILFFKSPFKHSKWYMTPSNL